MAALWLGWFLRVFCTPFHKTEKWMCDGPILLPHKRIALVINCAVYLNSDPSHHIEVEIDAAAADR